MKFRPLAPCPSDPDSEGDLDEQIAKACTGAMKTFTESFQDDILKLDSQDETNSELERALRLHQ